VGDHGEVAGVDLDRRRPHARGELTLGVRRDRLVFGGDDEPRRRALPARLTHRVFEGAHRDRLLHGVERAGAIGVEVGGEVADEIVLRQPAEALRVDGDVGQRRARGPTAEQRSQRLALVDAEGGDVDQADDVRVRPERGDDLATVGVAGEDGRALEAVEDLAQAGDVVLGRGLGELRRDDGVALGLEGLGHGAPTRTVGPGPVDEDDVR
jgi:hypothetical protein